MSFGFSPSDIVMLVNGFYKLTEVLKKSPAEFQHLLSEFSRLCDVARRLSTITSTSPESDEALCSIQSEIGRVLYQFFSRIKQFEKHLGSGRNRDRFALSNVVHKIKWATKVGELNALLQDVKSLNALITTHMVIDIKILLSASSSIPSPIENRFAFEDANRRAYALDLGGSVSIPPWTMANSRTRRAINHIIQGDVEAFIHDFDAQVEGSGLTETPPSRRKTRDWLKKNLLNTGGLESAAIGSEKPKMGDFLRVVLCCLQWESQERFASVRRAEGTLDGEMQRIQSILHAIDSRPFDPLESVSRLLRCRFVVIHPFEESLRSFWACYGQRNDKGLRSKQLSEILEILNGCTLKSGHPFYPSVLTARCLVWIYSRILSLESILVLGTATIIHGTFSSDSLTSETPLPFRIFNTVFVPSVLLARFTGRLVEDAAALLSPDVPEYHLASVCRIVKDSRSLSIKYLAQESLEDYNLDLTPRVFFQYTAFTPQSVSDGWLRRYRQTLEEFLVRASMALSQFDGGTHELAEELQRAMAGFLESS